MKKYYIILIWLFVSGCTIWTNPTPNIIDNDIISYDNGIQNGGILQTYTYLDVNNNKNEGFIITENAKNRYNSLIHKYGNRFIPELKQNVGIIEIQNNNKIYYFISAQYMIYFADMMDYYRLDKYFDKK